MNDFLIKAFDSHPMFEGISLTNCEALTNCLGCTEKTYMKGQIISTAELYSRQIGIIVSGCIHTIQEDVWGRCAFLSYTGL